MAQQFQSGLFYLKGGIYSPQKSLSKKSSVFLADFRNHEASWSDGHIMYCPPLTPAGIRQRAISEKVRRLMWWRETEGSLQTWAGGWLKAVGAMTTRDGQGSQAAACDQAQSQHLIQIFLRLSMSIVLEGQRDVFLNDDIYTTYSCLLLRSYSIWGNESNILCMLSYLILETQDMYVRISSASMETGLQEVKVCPESHSKGTGART